MSLIANKGPDFLIVGAQRSGTTWLHRVLREHPSLWLPPVKELHYFDKLETTRTIRDYKERRRVGLKGLLSLDPWLFRYWFMRRGDDWYAELFRKARARGFTVGEVTPAYATLDAETLRRIHQMNSEVKLIFIMRDPVERTWSAIQNAAQKGADISAHEKMIEQANSRGTTARSAYADTIRRLEAVFPREQIHYCFFDDLRDRPESFATEILRFLGVDSGSVRRLLPPSVVNSAAGSKKAPLEFQREMARAYLPTVAELCRRFEGAPQKWRVRYEKLLDSGSEVKENAAAKLREERLAL